MPSPADKVHALLAKVSRLQFVITVLICVLISTGLLVLGWTQHDDTKQAVILGFATSFLASTIFAALFTLFSAAATERALRASVTESIRDHREILAREFVEFLPAASYPEGSTPDRATNAALTRALADALEYTFFGLTGKLVGMRLGLLDGHRLETVVVIVADPRSPATLEQRISQQSGEKRELSPDEAAKDVKDGIAMCLVGLHRCRNSHGSVRLCLTTTPSLDRAEITDKIAFVSKHHARLKSTSRYSPTYAWDATSLTYRTTKRETKRIQDAAADKSIYLTPTTTEGDLIAFLSTACDLNVDAEKLHGIIARFAAEETEMRDLLSGHA